MKLKSMVAAVALATVGLAANASDYTFKGDSLPTGVSVHRNRVVRRQRRRVRSRRHVVRSYSVTVSPFGTPTSPTLVESGSMLGGGWFLSNKIFGPGSYYASAGGTGAFSGFYSTVPAAAVPEPETYAMMLAGLGVMGFVAARRKS